MNTRLASLLLPTLLPTLLVAPLAAPLVAQEGFGTGPAKELEKLAPWIGNWSGGGKMVEPGGAESAWTAQGSYQWCLNKHFVQEDLAVHFEGTPSTMVFRSYLGWDREGRRYVRALATNQGVARLNEIDFQPDGTMVVLIRHHQEGLTYVERARTRVVGDSLTMVIDVLMPEGASLTVGDSKLTRTDKPYGGNWDEGGWMGTKPNEHMKKLGSISGTYAIQGEMVMEPGKPTMKITGTDEFAMVWGGNIMHGRTDGTAEGSPEAYESHAFWGWDGHRNSMRAVFVDNVGQVGEMDVRWVEGHLVSWSATTMQGMPTTQRFVITLDDKGGIKNGVGHTVTSTMDPFVSFKATYAKKG